MDKYWERMAVLLLEAYYLEDETKKSVINVDNLEGNHSGYIQQYLINNYKNIYTKDKFNLDKNNKINRKKEIHKQIQDMIAFLVCLIKNVLKENTYYQSELAKKFCTKHLKDKNWIILTILEMCKNQGIIEETKYKNKNYYKIKDENKNYNKLYYFEKINKLSKNESLIKSFLDDNNIKYKMQYTFNDLIYKKKLRFDFCLEGSNFQDDKFILLEYDGKQHFEKTSYFHKKDDSFNDQKKKDEQKNDYAKQNGYKLIRIKYTEDPIEIIKNIIMPLLK